MALKPRNLDWLNVSDGFQPYFQWPKGLVVLNLCNFIMLMGVSGFAAQLLFGIPHLSTALVPAEGAAAQEGGFDFTLLIFAVLAFSTLLMVRFGLYGFAAVTLFGMGFFVLVRFAELFLLSDNLQFESFADIVLLPISLSVGVLIAAVLFWSGVVVFRAGRRQ